MYSPYGSGAMVRIRPLNLFWLHKENVSADLCAHGRVEVRIGDDVVVRPDQGDVTVSAAALYLMRTLERPHSKQARVGDQLFPCCGFTMWDHPGSADVLIVGCPNGIDLEVEFDRGDVVVRAGDDRSWVVPLVDWRSAVFAFADDVAAFYSASAPKTPSADDEPGFRKFAAEWARRRGRPFFSPVASPHRQ
jgi:hypothetical protein